MTADSEDHEKETLLKFIYQTPLGLAQFSDEGNIELLNATGVALFYQFFPHSSHSNIYKLFEDDIPELKTLVTSGKSGLTTCNQTITKVVNQETFFLTAKTSKLYQTTNMLIIDDITDIKKKELALTEAHEKIAVERGKLEVSSGILHDIGNAISGIKATVSKHLAYPEWDELNSFRKLVSYLEGEAEKISNSLGQSKGPALFKFMNEILKTMNQRREDWTVQASYLSTGIEHIEQILRIQKNYVGNFRAETFSELHLDRVMFDALRMSEPLTSHHKITVIHNIDPHKQWLIGGDPTRIMQVLLNLIKNSCEAMENSSVRELHIKATMNKDKIAITIEDTGEGLSESDPFLPGATSKKYGSGLGLAMVKNIVLAHHGTISIENRDHSTGCLTAITFPKRKGLSDGIY